MKKQPRGVSIIILTHNKLEYTKECLEAVDRFTTGHQVVVVDNASTDGTPEFLQAYEADNDHVRVVLSKRNLGVAGGRNQGVAVAKHGTICLLDNDVVPLDEKWLDSMVEVLTGDVGIVGSKLLLPDGTIQHCGIEFEYKGRPTPHFDPYLRYVNRPGDLPEANVLEEVPAVTGSLLLTTKKVWDRVDGMDEGYTIGTFEDIDFSLAVRDKGFRIIYQPASVLTHHWRATVASKRPDAPDAPGRYLQQNFQRLMGKWFVKLRQGLATVGPAGSRTATSGQAPAVASVVDPDAVVGAAPAPEPAPAPGMQKGLVTVVIPCYQQAHWLGDAIESALASTYSPVEVVVVNDGSTDDTSAVARDYPVTLVEQPNQGLSAARNSGIGVARGEFILPLDADDTIDPTYIEKAVKLVAPGVGIVRCFTQNFGDDDTRWSLREVHSVADLLLANAITCCSLFRKADWWRVGGFDEKMRGGYEDWEFWIRIVATGLTVETVPEFLLNYRKHGRSMVNDTIDRHSEIHRYIVEKHFDIYRRHGLA